MQVLGSAGLFTAPGTGSGVHWAEHLRVSDLSVGTYSIAAGADDDQEPHTEDEIYVVTAGQATLEAGGPGGQAAPVGPGSVIYVPAGEPHRFTGVNGDLAVIVLFAPAEYSRASAGH
jgi:mannose-6-phosphate isomerase-like protein (cupin superfamily)